MTNRLSTKPHLSFHMGRMFFSLAFFWILSHQSSAYIPEVNRRAIAGLWKLTHKAGQPKPAIRYPMKEFTVFPKHTQKMTMQKPTTDDMNAKEMLLMLHEDGHFVQYASDDAAEGEVKIPDKLNNLKGTDAILEKFQFTKIKGQWDFVDGRLILAADRPMNGINQDNNPDTLFEGRVVAHSEVSLQDNPMLKHDDEPKKASKVVDTHLSVPKGKIKAGKFFYPMSHPSFFDQPMFKPIRRGGFELKQVLGSLNARSYEEEKELNEKFRAKDFYGKRFLLSSHPIAQRRPKGNTRWSIKYNRFVEDPPSKEAKRRQEEEENRPVNIRVIEVAFFANNTFATINGLGDNILRGKFHIVGEDRDQLWMQVWRFGFGRSVSGSVYSEGKSLSTDDEKTYWGKITDEDETEDPMAEDETDGGDRRLVVNGSVIFGYGLEPQPVGHFIMTETNESENYGDDEEEDDDEVEDDNGERDKGDESDWSNAFQ